MQKYFPAFISNGYDDFDIMDEIAPEDLDEIGVVDEEDRKKILTSVASLKLGLVFNISCFIDLPISYL